MRREVAVKRTLVQVCVTVVRARRRAASNAHRTSRRIEFTAAGTHAFTPSELH